jgi:uncharacterized membrane protein YqaE (UPF0057 family)
MGRLLLIILCLFFLWAFLLQLLGHIPGVIYGIYQVTRD